MKRTPCAAPAVKDVIQWREPIWAAPDKPRGKPDQIGEQLITAEVTAIDDSYHLSVRAAEKLEGGAAAAVKVKTGDVIRRKKSTIVRGDCHRLG